jgi:hypothetical protein
MDSYLSIADLNQRGLFTFKRLYADLTPLGRIAVTGTWRATFTGPAWLRAIAPRGLHLLRFGGWWGKEIHADGTAINLFFRDGHRTSAYPMAVSETRSLLDNKPCLATSYSANAPIPWRFVVDEFRALDENTLLGLTILGKPSTINPPLPFILQRA